MRWKDDRRFGPILTRRTGSATTEDFPDVLLAFKKLPKAAVLGDPGSGKSTTLRKLGLDLAKDAQGNNNAPLPIFAELGKWTGDESLLSFLAATAPELDLAPNTRPFVLLLDGLNEMPTAKRKHKTAQILQFHSQGIFVTCREEDYTCDLDLRLDKLTLKPLTRDRIRDVLRHWTSFDPTVTDPQTQVNKLFWQLAGDSKLSEIYNKWLAAGATEDQFWTSKHPRDIQNVWTWTTSLEDEIWLAHIPANDRSLLKLAANPFLLTMLFHVWRRPEGELPKNRGDLFRVFIECLLVREELCFEQPEGSRIWVNLEEGDQLLYGLGEVAWRMQRSGLAGDSVVTSLSEPEVVVSLGGSASRLKLARAASLLETGADGTYKFRHQLLQEYFAACALEHRRKTLKASELWPAGRWWQRNGWEEAAILLAGLHPENFGEVIEWLLEAQPGVALRCITESGAGVQSDARIRQLLTSCWKNRLLSEPHPFARAAIGRALGKYDLDDRPGTGLKEGLPDIDWVHIPVGNFIYQDEKKSRLLPGFAIAKYPITNKQFQAFVDAVDGYQNDDCWTGLDMDNDHNRKYFEPRWPYTNHPRESVSWFEATAFCRWLSKRSGGKVTLPTEEQWERAARGTDGREFPWGHEFDAAKCNTDEGGVGLTTSVGIYLDGASADGVLDLIGNVWEWCLNEYSAPKRTQSAGGETRVLRGGSWAYDEGKARAAFRDHFSPHNGNSNIGFRVVRHEP